MNYSAVETIRGGYVVTFTLADSVRQDEAIFFAFCDDSTEFWFIKKVINTRGCTVDQFLKRINQLQFDMYNRIYTGIVNKHRRLESMPKARLHE